MFEAVEKSLYAEASFLPSDDKYLGSLLLSVERISVEELIDRLCRLEGVENEYFALRQLGGYNLLFESSLSELVPEWQNHNAVRLKIRLPSGKTEDLVRDLPVKLQSLHRLKSRIDLPKTDDAGFVSEFLKPLEWQEEIAYLRVDHMLGYREAREMAVAVGTDSLSADELEAIPSATGTFRSLVVEMKKRNTQTLIVDLRNNGGGNYMMAPILVYFLHGKEALASIQKEAEQSGGGHGGRYSKLYFENHPKVTMEKINAERWTPLVLGDIDFGSGPDTSAVDSDTSVVVETPERLERYRQAPTFFAEYESGNYSAHYCPKNVVVLMTPWTSSSGLDMTLYLYRTGAILIGTPSAQAPNSWGDVLEWKLDHSGVTGEVSSAFDIAFGDDPAKGRVLPVHYPLTYEKFAAYEFDPNVIFLYALEVLRDL
jgi:hypothetical protein